MSFQHGNSVSLIWKKLKKGDYTVRPFEIYKRWDIASSAPLFINRYIWGWGDNTSGGLGHGDVLTRKEPLQIGESPKWSSISIGGIYGVGTSTFAISQDSTLWGWGKNEFYELGDGTTNNRFQPKQISGDKDWYQVASGDSYSNAIKKDGSLWGWGTGPIGDGTLGPKFFPKKIGTDLDWSVISVKNSNSLAIKTNGTLWGWGRNTYGQLGDGTTTPQYSPIQIGTDVDWKAISSGFYHTLAIKTNGTLWSWGRNTYGELGDGTSVDTTTPNQIGTDTDWVFVVAGNHCSFAIKTDGTLWAWGLNNNGKLGFGDLTNRNVPTQVGTSTDWLKIDTGHYHTVGLKTDGTLWGWGYNDKGQIGDGTLTTRQSPVQIGTNDTWNQVYAGVDSSIGITEEKPEVKIKNVGLHGIQILRAFYPENHKYFGGVANLESSMYQRVFTSQSMDPKLLWYYLDHNFYTEYSKEKIPTVVTEYDRITYLAESSSVMIIPQGVFGEGIKRDSFKVTSFNETASLHISMFDDGKGNIKDTIFDETKMVGTNNLALYLGFNEKYREYNFRNKPTNYVIDGSPFSHNITSIRNKSISYLPGIVTTDTSQSSGVSAYLDGGFYRLERGDKFNYSGRTSFAFSFWLNIPPTQSNLAESFNSIFDKKTIRDSIVIDQQTKFVSVSETGSNLYSTATNYPFDIILYNQSASIDYRNKIQFSQKSGNNLLSVTSSVISHSMWNHIVCQKSASYYQIWVNGVLSGQTTGSIETNTSNDHKFYIGGNGTFTSSYSGHLDEIRIYNTHLTSEQITYLGNNSFESGYAYQTARIGNIFYKHGMVVISDPRPKYWNVFLGKTGNFDYDGDLYGYTGSFRGTTTFYEHEITCKIRKNEFNFTQNWSVRKDKNESSILVEDYATSSFFNPYITTIGLYNESYELVAIGKMASPLEKRDDVDMNVIIRFDV